MELSDSFFAHDVSISEADISFASAGEVSLMIDPAAAVDDEPPPGEGINSVIVGVGGGERLTFTSGTELTGPMVSDSDETADRSVLGDTLLEEDSATDAVDVPNSSGVDVAPVLEEEEEEDDDDGFNVIIGNESISEQVATQNLSD